MQLIKPPQPFEQSKLDQTPSLFLAGGISNCPNWQKPFVDFLQHRDVIILNPRRDEYDPMMDQDQVTWEHDNIRKVSGHAFWFPAESVCPISLWHLGGIVGRTNWKSDKRLFVGTDPKYPRAKNLKIQLLLTVPHVNVVSSLEELATLVQHWIRRKDLLPENSI